MLLSCPAFAQCFNEGFESSNPGPLPFISPSWTVSESINSPTNTIICGTIPYTFYTPSTVNNAVVMTTPVSDPYCNNVTTSPFGGNHVLRLSGDTTQTTNRITRVTKTINVTNTNWFYKFAYKCVLMKTSPPHDCCYNANVMFRFYDCSNNYLSALSSTFVASTPTCLTSYSSCAIHSEQTWLKKPHPVAMFDTILYNQDWVVEGVNLAPYIGSCVTVEVLASNCYGGAHQGYLYYDGQCSANAIVTNNNFPATTSYTVCSPNATLSAPPCFDAYLWQGPSGSGVSGLTASVVTSSVSGIYTLELSLGTNTFVQTLNLVVNSIPPGVTIMPVSGSGYTVCAGGSISLTASGSSLVSYDWGGGHTASVYTLAPSFSTIISLTATNVFGCVTYDAKTITVLPLPVIGVNSGTICAGNSFSIAPYGASSYIFQGGTALVSPVVNSSYTVLGIYNGCISLPVISNVTVYSLTVSANNGSICAGDSFAISPSGADTYTFSSGSPLVSPTVSTSYTITGANTFGCKSPSAVVNIDVSSMTDISWISQPIQCLENNSFNFLLKNNPAPGTDFEWSFTSSATPSVSYLASPSNVVFKEAGLFFVNVSAHYRACYKSAIDTVRVIDPHPPLVNWDTTIVIGQLVKLNAFAGAGFTYTWGPLVNYLDCTTCPAPDPVSATSVSIVYTVSVEDWAHCHVTQNTYGIIVELKTSLDVPTAFTPNGDGINDVIFAAGWGIKKLLYFRIFNRWGQLLFESNDLKTGWDGTFNSVPQNTETYVYQVSAETLIIGEKAVIKSGTLKLIR